MEQFVDKLSWGIIIVLCLSIGLAPYAPPHVVQKLRMLFKGKLTRPLDIFDLLMHGFPWVLLVLKALYSLKK